MDSFTWDGINMADYGLQVIERPHQYLPRPKVIIHDLAGATGAVTQGAYWEPLYLDMKCAVVCDDPDTLEANLLAIAGALYSTQKGEKSLVLSWRPGITYTARLLSEMKTEPMLNGALFDLRFIVPQPDIPEEAGT